MGGGVRWGLSGLHELDQADAEDDEGDAAELADGDPGAQDGHTEDDDGDLAGADHDRDGVIGAGGLQALPVEEVCDEAGEEAAEGEADDGAGGKPAPVGIAAERHGREAEKDDDRAGADEEAGVGLSGAEAELLDDGGGGHDEASGQRVHQGSQVCPP